MNYKGYIEKQYSGSWRHLSEKNRLSPAQAILNKYHGIVSPPQHLVVGGKINCSAPSKNVIAGPCYLTSWEIRELKKGGMDSEKLGQIASMHPTFEDVVATPIVYPLSASIFYWEEISYYSKRAAESGVDYDKATILFKNENSNILNTQKKLASLKRMQVPEIKELPTNEPSIEKLLDEISEKHKEDYAAWQKKENVSEKAMQMVKICPAKFVKLKIVSTYNPVAIGKSDAIAVESIQNMDNIGPAADIFNIEAMLLAEPKCTKAQQLRMNSSSSHEGILYLGGGADLEVEIKKIAEGGRTPHSSGWFNLAWFLFDNPLEVAKKYGTTEWSGVKKEIIEMLWKMHESCK